MKKFLNRLAVLFKNSFPKKISTPKFIHPGVPYFAQWESRELVKDILSSKIKAENDPKWRTSGAKSKQEYSNWSWSGCGMACTKMLLAHRKGKIVPLVKLGKQCLKYGGYKLPLEKHPGLYYEPYTHFLTREYSLKAKALGNLILSDILVCLSDKGYVIASVTPEIRNPETSPRQHGGHLVLVIGYDLAKQNLYFQNPSGITKTNQEYVAIKFNDFQKFFAHKGILVN